MNELEVVNATALEAMTRAEIDVSIATAKRFARDEKKALAKATAQATINEDIADEMIYHVPRAGKELEGPTIRMAEIIASAWGNMRIGARILEVGEREVTAQGIAMDLETNIQESTEVKRGILTREGKRFTPDMIIVTSQAAMSIARRNAILHIVPKAFWSQCYEEAKRCIANGATSIAQRRAKALEWLVAHGIPMDAILRRLDRQKVGEITGEDLVSLRGIVNAAREQQIELAEEFDVRAPVARATAAPIPTAQIPAAPAPMHRPPAEAAREAAAMLPPPVKRPVGRPPKVSTAPSPAPGPEPIGEPEPEPEPDITPPVRAPIEKPATPARALVVNPKNELWRRWCVMRGKFTAAETKVIRGKAEVQYINFVLPEEQLAAVVAAAVEILEEKQGAMLPEEGASA